MAAPDLEIVRAAGRKPTLAGGPTFSYSGSEGVGLLAVGRGHEVGVDLERWREVPEASALVARYFTPAERARWLAEGGGGGVAFLRSWTRLEATLKARGTGLAALDGDRSTEPAGIEVHDLDLVPGFAAALAIDLG